LRPHQQEAVGEVVAGFRESDRGQLIMACGTGKTLTALSVHERLAATRTLVLVPSLALLDQSLREWVAHASGGFDFLAVCSDVTVVGGTDDSSIARTAELGFPVTTDPTAIAEFLRHGRAGRPSVAFATYQSSPRIAEAMRRSGVPELDLTVCDEAHRCTGRVESTFATVLDSSAIRSRRRLFMTATPRFFTHRVRQRAHGAGVEVSSMDDVAIFGAEFHRLSFAQAIRRGLLTDYQVAVVCIDDAEYQQWVRDARSVLLSDSAVTDAATLAAQIGLAKALRRYDLRRVITFHSRVQRARDFSRSLGDVVSWLPECDRPDGRVWSDYASGEMTAGQRQAKLQRLRSVNQQQRGILSNARCLAEGVDVPALDGVAFVDPRSAEVDIIQAVGRAIRLAPDKTVGTIVIPVFIDPAESAYEALENSTTFRPVWDIIKALRAHDDELGVWIDQARLRAERNGSGNALPDRVHLDLPERIGQEFADALGVRLVTETADPWEVAFTYLEDFVASHGTARVPYNHVASGDVNLGEWVKTQRKAYRCGALSPARESRLSALPGWEWVTRASAAAWDENYARLLRHVDQHGTACVPSHYRDSDGFRLDKWIERQRTAHAAGELAASCVSRLAALPGWRWAGKTGGGGYTDYTSWETAFGFLHQFAARNGHARVPQNYVCDVTSYRLGNWVAAQRRAYRCGTLSAHRAARLAELPGWVWACRRTKERAHWEAGFVALQRHIEAHGTAQAPTKFVDTDGFRLGRWISAQRTAHTAGKLDADRAEKLEALPGWSWAKSWPSRWDEGFDHLEKYFAHNGTARVPASYVDSEGFRLGTWVVTQRRAYISGQNGPIGQLTRPRIHQLEALPGWTWRIEMPTWDYGFSRLCAYLARHGHARPQNAYVEDDGMNLGQWVANQRTAHKNGTLASSRVRQLEELPGWAWRTSLGDRWEDGFDHLQRYVVHLGTARVPLGDVTSGGAHGMRTLQPANASEIVSSAHERLTA
jgi:superfamily II DNA or RNA helicase